jgi:cytoskeletal protein CcmA (bactofilin family)
MPENSMTQKMRLGLMIAVAMAAGCGKKDKDAMMVDVSTHVTAAQQNGDVETIHGVISIDDNAKLGAAKSVDGDIYLGAHASAASLRNENGSITADKGSRVYGNVSAINGAITVLDDAEISGSVSEVNGTILVNNGHIAGDIKTNFGDVRVSGTSVVDGGIRVKNLELGVLHQGQHTSRIIVGPGVRIHGDIRFEHEGRLFVSDKATIGAVSGVEAVKFSGDDPPP